MYYGVPDEGGLGYYAMHNQEVSRSDSDSVAEDSTPCSRQGGPRLDEHGKRKAGKKVQDKNCEAERSF